MKASGPVVLALVLLSVLISSCGSQQKPRVASDACEAAAERCRIVIGCVCHHP